MASFFVTTGRWGRQQEVSLQTGWLAVTITPIPWYHLVFVHYLVFHHRDLNVARLNNIYIWFICVAIYLWWTIFCCVTWFRERGHLSLDTVALNHLDLCLCVCLFVYVRTYVHEGSLTLSYNIYHNRKDYPISKSCHWNCQSRHISEKLISPYISPPQLPKSVWRANNSQG